MGGFKPRQQWALLIMLVVSATCVGLSIASFGISFGSPSKWLSSAGILFDLSGLLQLEIAGVFERVFEEYSDDEKYPYRPPSHITREIIDWPDEPVRMKVEFYVFRYARTGIILIVSGALMQLVGNWLP